MIFLPENERCFGPLFQNRGELDHSIPADSEVGVGAAGVGVCDGESLALVDADDEVLLFWVTASLRSN